MPVSKIEVSGTPQIVKNYCELGNMSIEANSVDSYVCKLPIISLFSGALGLDLGLEKAGFQTRVAVECNKFAADTIRKNRPGIPVIEKKIEDVTTEEILEIAKLRPGEPVIVTGGPSCQSFSTVGQRGSLTDPRGMLFQEFLRVIRETQPQFFIMENVKGIFSAAIKHRPLKERGLGYPPLEPEEELGSGFVEILKELRDINYYTVFDLLNTANYGVPQVRERAIFIGSRDGEPVAIPEPTHAKDPVNDLVRWVTLKEGLEGLEDKNPLYRNFNASKRQFIQIIPEGGNWRNLPPELQEQAIGGAYKSWGGRGGFLRRLSWSQPSPTLTTNPDGKATMLCHPTECRPLSVKEYARLQQFPDSWEFSGSLSQQYTQIGNAVPIGLGKAIGQAIQKVIQSDQKMIKRTGIYTREDLLKRLVNRPRTMLSPPNMWKIKDREAAREWMNGHNRNRIEILEYVSCYQD
ncbi:DNA cytosine methyltransferase [Scytonema sp. NUACC26]|uniref:DNA cytosine methyltransferase n=1 Tax=Scytonema sp. NUACC26 TaxID=3140176 RepID=UPI0034DCC01C